MNPIVKEKLVKAKEGIDRALELYGTGDVGDKRLFIGSLDVVKEKCQSVIWIAVNEIMDVDGKI